MDGRTARPGDTIIDKYMPDATETEREGAHRNLRAFLAVMVRIARRSSASAERSPEIGGRRIIPEADSDRV